MPTSSIAEVWPEIARAAEQESPLWAEALRPEDERDEGPIFSTLGEPRYALGVETIYEGYLAHYGAPRLFAPADSDIAILLGDYLYAHGLVRIAAEQSVEAVADLAELISLCARLRAEGLPGDGPAWAATVARLGRGELEDARAALRDHGDASSLVSLARAGAGEAAVEQALAAHAARLG